MAIFHLIFGLAAFAGGLYFSGIVNEEYESRELKDARMQIVELSKQKGDLDNQLAELRLMVQKYEVLDHKYDAHMAREAAVARACELLFSLCPDSWTEHGRQALKDRYSGFTSPRAWIELGGLLLFFGIIAISLRQGYLWIHLNFTAPKIAEVKDREARLAKCDFEMAAREASMQKREATHIKKCHALTSECHELMATIEALKAEQAAIREEHLKWLALEQLRSAI